MTPPMTNSPEASLEEAVKRLEEEIEIQLCDAANLEGDFEADDPNAGVYTATVARHRQIASDLRTLLTSYRAQAALLEEAEEKLRTRWELLIPVGEVVDLKAQLSSLQSDNDTLRAALEEIRAHAERHPVPERNFKSYSSGFNVGYGLASEHLAKRAAVALSTTRGRG